VKELLLANAVAHDERGRVYLSRAAAAALIVLGAVFGAGVVLVWHYSTSASATSDSPAATSQCLTALTSADLAIAEAKTMKHALAVQIAAMNDLLNQKITQNEALTRALPTLTSGVQTSAQFNQDARTYTSAARVCRGR